MRVLSLLLALAAGALAVAPQTPNEAILEGLFQGDGELLEPRLAGGVTVFFASLPTAERSDRSQRGGGTVWMMRDNLRCQVGSPTGTSYGFGTSMVAWGDLLVVSDSSTYNASAATVHMLHASFFSARWALVDALAARGAPYAVALTDVDISVSGSAGAYVYVLLRRVDPLVPGRVVVLPWTWDGTTISAEPEVVIDTGCVNGTVEISSWGTFLVVYSHAVGPYLSSDCGTVYQFNNSGTALTELTGRQYHGGNAYPGFAQALSLVSNVLLVTTAETRRFPLLLDAAAPGNPPPYEGYAGMFSNGPTGLYYSDIQADQLTGRFMTVAGSSGFPGEQQVEIWDFTWSDNLWRPQIRVDGTAFSCGTDSVPCVGRAALIAPSAWYSDAYFITTVCCPAGNSRSRSWRVMYFTPVPIEA